MGEEFASINRVWKGAVIGLRFQGEGDFRRDNKTERRGGRILYYNPELEHVLAEESRGKDKRPRMMKVPVNRESSFGSLCES